MDDGVVASPLKNLTGGGGCGCGCLGLLIALAGGLALATIPLEVLPAPTSGPMAVGIGAVVTGILVFLFGSAVYVGSLFLD